MLGSGYTGLPGHSTSEDSLRGHEECVSKLFPTPHTPRLGRGWETPPVTLLLVILLPGALIPLLFPDKSGEQYSQLALGECVNFLSLGSKLLKT